VARVIAGELLEDGWLPPRAAAAKLGISVDQLEALFRRGAIKRKQVLPNTRLYLYAVGEVKR
jgi:hypothetical protein